MIEELYMPISRRCLVCDQIGEHAESVYLADKNTPVACPVPGIEAEREELKAEVEEFKKLRSRDDRLSSALQLPYDLEQGLNEAIREGLRDARVNGVIATHVARILDRIAPWINRELELKSVVHQCCVDVKDLKAELERTRNVCMALESEVADTSLARYRDENAVRFIPMFGYPNGDGADIQEAIDRLDAVEAKRKALAETHDFAVCGDPDCAWVACVRCGQCEDDPHLLPKCPAEAKCKEES